jgi:DNA-binding SARP family transcriptional activator
MLAVKLFAGACLQDGQRPLTGPPTQRRRLALLALLAASHPCGLTRAKVVAYLWPERGVERARNLLSQAIYVLRKTFGEAAIQAAGEELRLNPDVIACDVVLFQQALAAGDAKRAVDLYSGPFLDGFFLSGAPEFEYWADGERERYRRAYAAVLESLARSAEASDVAASVEWWLRLAAEDPGSSRVTLRLMEALEATGDRAGALRQARIHAALLETEFDAQPDPDVAALADRLRTQPAAGPSIPGGAGTEPQNGAPDCRTSHSTAASEPRDVVLLRPDSTARHREVWNDRSIGNWRRYAIPGAALAVAAVVLSAAWLRGGPGHGRRY